MGRNQLQGSKPVTRVETSYKGVTRVNRPDPCARHVSWCAAQAQAVADASQIDSTPPLPTHLPPTSAITLLALLTLLTLLTLRALLTLLTLLTLCTHSTYSTYSTLLLCSFTLPFYSTPSLYPIATPPSSNLNFNPKSTPNCCFLSDRAAILSSWERWALVTKPYTKRPPFVSALRPSCLYPRLMPQPLQTSAMAYATQSLIGGPIICRWPAICSRVR